MVLEPSTDAIAVEDRSRYVVASPCGSFEMWSLHQTATESPTWPLVVLKFPGTGGRAERLRPHPTECWPRCDASIYAVNPPGYGGSGGRARVIHIPIVAAAAYTFVREQHAGSLLVVGNSLGCLAALYLAARFPVDALYLRNPAPVHQLIRRRWKYNWWNLGLARCIAARIPSEIDAVRNAAKTTVPCFLVSSAGDRLVPPRFQDELAQKYAGPLRRFVVAGADHHDAIPDEQRAAYVRELEWLRERLAPLAASPPRGTG